MGEPAVKQENKFYNPFNFVELSDKVFEPTWSDQISHDIPFSDSTSGIIDIGFKSVSPIMVKESKLVNFQNINGKYFIPATSIKGMIRNVLEILSLSKITTLTKNDRYSVRDLSAFNKDYTIKQNLNKIKPGLLMQIRGNYALIECETYERLDYKDIGKIVKNPDVAHRIKNAGSVREKYKLIKENPFYYKYKDDDSAWIIVMTGKMFNKKKEYGFKLPEIISPITLEEDTIRDFLFIYEKETSSKTWEYWKKKINSFNDVPTIREITNDMLVAPVFYYKEAGKIKHLGLTFLYREPFENSIYDLIPDAHKNFSKMDLSEAIFGRTGNENHKGRVQFSHAFFTKTNEMDKTQIVLGSPKPTFFPFYLVQNLKDKYSTFSDHNAKINGWKRYLIHKDTFNQDVAHLSPNVKTVIKPLGSDSEFTCKIRFHNLRKTELGALLSAITFHGNHDKFYHLIGMAKPLGYGKLKISELKLSTNQPENMVDFMVLFEQLIVNNLFEGNFSKWADSVKSLFNFALERNDGISIRYPKAFDEFKYIKQNNLDLSDFSPAPAGHSISSLSD